MNLRYGQHFGQRLVILDSHVGQRLPVAFAGARVEEFEAAEGDSQRSAGELFVVLQMQKELSQLVFGDPVG